LTFLTTQNSEGPCHFSQPYYQVFRVMPDTQWIRPILQIPAGLAWVKNETKLDFK